MYYETTAVEVTAKTKMTIEVTSPEALRILCKTLDMGFIFDDDRRYYPRRVDEETCYVCYKDNNGSERVMDERGDLFVALCNVCVNMFPNTDIRGEDFIYRYGLEETE